MEKKPSLMHYRRLLMESFSKKDLFGNITDRIVHLIGKSETGEEKEATAKAILELINSSKTKTEISEKLEAMEK